MMNENQLRMRGLDGTEEVSITTMYHLSSDIWEAFAASGDAGAIVGYGRNEYAAVNDFTITLRYWRELRERLDGISTPPPPPELRGNKTPYRFI